MIGKYFSNGWKKWADFSNDWKNFSRVFQRLEKIFGTFLGNKWDKGGNQTRGEQGMSDNYDNFRQFSEKASWTTLLREERGRETGGISATKDTKGTKGEGRRAGRRAGVGAGGGNLQGWLVCRCADLNGLEGEEIYIEKSENRFADRNAWSADGGRQLGQLGTTFSRCRADNSARWKRANGTTGGETLSTSLHQQTNQIFFGHSQRLLKRR